MMTNSGSTAPAISWEEASALDVHLSSKLRRIIGQLFGAFRDTLDADDRRQAAGESSALDRGMRALLAHLQGAPITADPRSSVGALKPAELPEALAKIPSATEALVGVCRRDEEWLADGLQLRLHPTARGELERFLEALAGLLPISSTWGPEAAAFGAALAQALDRPPPQHPEAKLPRLLTDVLFEVLTLRAILDLEGKAERAGKPGQLQPAVRAAAHILAEAALHPDFPAMTYRTDDGTSIDLRPGTRQVLRLKSYANDEVIASCLQIREQVRCFGEVLRLARDDAPGIAYFYSPALVHQVQCCTALLTPLLDRVAFDTLTAQNRPTPLSLITS